MSAAAAPRASVRRRAPRAARSLALLFAVAACGGRATVPAPDVGRGTPLPPAEPAIIALPITISLGAVRARLEAAVPMADTLDRARCAALGGAVCHQYVYRREPLDVTMTGDRLEVRARLRYRGRVAAGGLATLGSCGYAPEPMRRAELSLATSLYWRSDWRLASRATAIAANLVDPCRVTALRVDATPLMRRVVDAQLRDLVGTVDSLVPAIANLAPVADSLWRSLQRPVALDSLSTVWLSVRPEHVSLVPPTAQAGTVRTGLVVVAQPQVVLGAAPVEAARPLPALTLARPTAGLRIPVDVWLPFADIEQRALALLAPDAAAEGITVEALDVWGAGDTIAVRVDVSGDLAGTFYLVGRVGYDAAARAVRIDGLDYTIESANVMTRLRTTLGAPLIRRALDRASRGGRLHVGAQLDSARAGLDRQLNRSLAPGVAVGGGMRDVRITGMHTTADAIVVRVILEGDARLFVQ